MRLTTGPPDQPVLRGSTRTAAVIGHPVAHSLSPSIHNAAFSAGGLDWAYVAFDVAPGSGVAAIEAMRALHLGGLSVTMPHKADVAAGVDRLTPDAARLGAVNCVAWEHGELVGHNTDGAGFVDSLRPALAGPLADQRCVVLGAGGAARAVVLALAQAGVTEIGVCNRTGARAAAAADLAGAAGRVVGVEDVADFDVVVNATSLGMRGTAGAGRQPVDRGRMRAGQVVVDLVYHPVETPLLRAAAAAGAVPVDGVGMLVHQAAHQFRLWTGCEAPVETMDAAARAALAVRG